MDHIHKSLRYQRVSKLLAKEVVPMDTNYVKVYDNTIVYIMCPANLHTGGAELLHQLGAQLISRGINACMYYYGQTEADPVHEYYKPYHVPYSSQMEDDPKNLLIFTETSLSAYYSVNNIRRVIWWLSVDHYLMNIQDYMGQVLEKPLSMPVPHYYLFGDNTCELHMVQSEYAGQFLRANGVAQARMAYLGDYLSEVFLAEAETLQTLEKRDLVLYNPKKGTDFTAKLIAASPDLHWLPIQNLSPRQVSLLLGGSKVYVDFGYHPGKDRIPREAAICGCCVVSGRRGAAANDQDVPIPSEYKFDDTEENIPAITEKIREIIADYSSHFAMFASYRGRICGEQAQFAADVERVFPVITKEK